MAAHIAARLALGRFRAGLLAGVGIEHDIATGIQNDRLMKHVRRRIAISPPEIAEYNRPENAPDWFPSANAFDGKTATLLSDCLVLPRSGVIMFPEDGIFLNESTIGFDVFQRTWMIESTAPAVRCDEAPLFPFATAFVYYHTLAEVMCAALQAREAFPGVRLLLHPSHAAYVDGMLDFFGFGHDDIVLSDAPVRAASCVLVPRCHQRSAVHPADARFLRGQIERRIAAGTDRNEMVFISRGGTPSRRLSNEKELEAAFARRGFRILRFEDMPFAEQMKTVRGARIIAAVHGSGLANLAAARSGTKVVEIISPEWKRSTFFRLASELGLQYNAVFARKTHCGIEAPVDEAVRATES